jgi:hypothetical protein
MQKANLAESLVNSSANNISRSSEGAVKSEAVPSLFGKGKGTGLLSASLIFFKIFSLEEETFIVKI